MPNVKLFNAVCAEDLIIKYETNIASLSAHANIFLRPDPLKEGGQRVAGVVSNFTLVALNHDTQSCMDPSTITAPITLSFTGHDGPFGASSVKRLESAGMLGGNGRLEGMRGLDMERAEGGVVEGTREWVPGLIVGGMEVAEIGGTNRMGPTCVYHYSASRSNFLIALRRFGGMFLSGRRAAEVAMQILDSVNIVDGEIVSAR